MERCDKLHNRIFFKDDIGIGRNEDTTCCFFRQDVHDSRFSRALCRSVKVQAWVFRLKGGDDLVGTIVTLITAYKHRDLRSIIVRGVDAVDLFLNNLFFVVRGKNDRDFRLECKILRT